MATVKVLKEFERLDKDTFEEFKEDLTSFLEFTRGGTCASHWVGVNCSTDGEQVLCVLPKYEQFDPARIFLDGLPYLSHREDYHPKKLFKVDVRSGMRVTMPEKLHSTWSLFLIIVFVEELKKLLDRRPKRDYRWQVHNQVGVVRGRIRMQDHIRLNLSRGLPHRICTESLEFDHQNPLNQILKEACIHAQQGWSHLRDEAKKEVPKDKNGNERGTQKGTGDAIDAIASKLRACMDLLHHVERPLAVTPTLITQARRGLKGHYAPYRPVLDWAVSILRNEYCRIRSEKNPPYKTVPFALNMNALFELHVRTTILKENDCKRCEPMDKKQNVFFQKGGVAWEDEPNEDRKYGPYSPREPDFIFEKGPKRILVECKYQRFRVKMGKERRWQELDWLEKFIRDENDDNGDDNGRDDPHFEVPRHGFFQALAYMQLFACDAGMIVYPTFKGKDALSGQYGASGTQQQPFAFVPIGIDKGDNASDESEVKNTAKPNPLQQALKYVSSCEKTEEA
jgi:hypothetical protein